MQRGPCGPGKGLRTTQVGSGLSWYLQRGVCKCHRGLGRVTARRKPEQCPPRTGTQDVAHPGQL